MFSKIFSTLSLVLALSVHVNGHTLITPALGVQGEGARRDVQVLGRKGGSCGDMNVAANIDTSTPVAAAADGTFTTTATNFNRLRDGSRELTAMVDSTGTGNSFSTPVTISQNGDPRPRQLSSDQIVASLPAGMTCTGGASGNLCLVSFVNGAIQGFGNCVVVSQAAAAGAGTAAETGAAGAGAAGTGAVAGTGAAGAAAGTGVVAGTGAAGAAGTGAVAGTGAAGAAGTGGTGAAGAAAGTGTAAGTETGEVAGTDVAGTGAGTAAAGTGAIGAGAAGVGATGANTVGTQAGVEAGTAGVASAPQAAAGKFTKFQPSQAGSRAARSLLTELESRGGDSVDIQVVKRALADWIWA